jgi:hypothetical protein
LVEGTSTHADEIVLFDVVLREDSPAAVAGGSQKQVLPFLPLDAEVVALRIVDGHVTVTLIRIALALC